jgi:hypothetical protein
MRTGPEKGLVPSLVIVMSNEQGWPSRHSRSPVFSTRMVEAPPPLAQAWPIG